MYYLGKNTSITLSPAAYDPEYYLNFPYLHHVPIVLYHIFVTQPRFIEILALQSFSNRVLCLAHAGEGVSGMLSFDGSVIMHREI